MQKKVAIIDYGAGNLVSLCNALSQISSEGYISNDADRLAEADVIIFPGVGSFSHSMNSITRLGIDKALYHHVSRGKPLLGICVGMQLLFSEGYEGGLTKGLGLVDGIVRELEPRKNCRIPHMGWNEVYGDDFAKISLFRGLADHGSFYFAHSYHVKPAEKLAIVYTDYCGIDIVAGFQIGQVYGVQFHPEKSQVLGLKLPKNLLSIESVGC